VGAVVFGVLLAEESFAAKMKVAFVDPVVDVPVAEIEEATAVEMEIEGTPKAVVTVALEILVVEVAVPAHLEEEA
jgi:hypothetical protein